MLTACMRKWITIVDACTQYFRTQMRTICPPRDYYHVLMELDRRGMVIRWWNVKDMEMWCNYDERKRPY
jgi:hypothetical protein